MRARESAIALIQRLMKQHGIPISRVVFHKRWSGKNCLARLLKDWDGFIGEIQGLKVSKMIRVTVDGKAVVDSQILDVIWGAIRQNLGSEMTVRPRDA